MSRHHVPYSTLCFYFRLNRLACLRCGMKLSQSARHICLLLLAELIAISAVGSYVQVKFYYKENPQRIGPSLASFIAEDGSCSPCTDLARLPFERD